MVERNAAGLVLTVLALDLRLGAVGHGLDQPRVDDAARAAQAEEHGVRAAIYFHAIRVVTVHRQTRDEVVARLIRAAETADAIRALHAAHGSKEVRKVRVRSGAAEISAQSGDLGPNGVVEQLVQIIGADVVHEILGDHRNRGGDIAEIGTEPRAGEGAGRFVAMISFRHDLEGRQLDGLLFRGCGSTRGCGGGLGDSGGRSGEPADESDEQGAEFCGHGY